MNLNERILLILNSISNKNRALDYIIIFIAKYLVFVVVLLSGMMLWKINGSILQLATALAIGFVLSHMLGHLFKIERPCERKDIRALFMPLSHWKSFPSDHTVAVFVCAGVLTLAGMPFISIFVMVIGILIGISRIIAGVHYPVDILGGALIGWFVGVAVGMAGQW
jgi:undecaprenyl-diphosphatase